MWQNLLSPTRFQVLKIFLVCMYENVYNFQLIKDCRSYLVLWTNSRSAKNVRSMWFIIKKFLVQAAIGMTRNVLFPAVLKCPFSLSFSKII